MKKNIFLLVFTLFYCFGFTQNIPKGANTIIVKNVEFRQLVTTLIDSGYIISKIDSNYYTVETEYKNCLDKNGKNTFINLSIYVRVKDSTATMTGKWYNKLFLSNGILRASSPPGPMDIYDVTYTWGGDKLAFLRMNNIALSLHGEISYLKL